MGTTGASDSVSSSLSSMLDRIRSLLPHPIPLAVGFGVSTQAHFEEVGRCADGVVIGSQLVTVIKDAGALGPAAAASAVEAYCNQVSGNRSRAAPLPRQKVSTEDKIKEVKAVEEKLSTAARFGEFGGAYVPEALYDALEELTTAYADARADPAFWNEWEGEFGYINRPSQLYEAKRLTEHVGGARIWFKREDLNHTGSHKVRLSFSFPPLFETPILTLLDVSCADQQRHRPDPPRPSHWQEAHHRRDRSGPARSRYCDRLRQVRPRVRRLHGRGGR